jgi:large subunit ribosomal protein L19
MPVRAIIQKQARKYVPSFPELRPGYTVRVHQKIQEAGRERLQVFEGLIIGLHRGACLTDATFTVRRIVEGIGVERVFPLCSPTVTKVEVVKVAPVRRAKLTFLRRRSGKAARLSERFTEAGEFAVAVAAPLSHAESARVEEGESAIAEAEARRKN